MFLRENAVAGHDPHFVITQESHESDLAQEVRLDAAVLNRMITHHSFWMNRVQIRRSSKASKTHIALCFTRGEYYPISGFPRNLYVNRPAQSGTFAVPCCMFIAESRVAGRHALSIHSSIRWADRSDSQQERRHEWKPPANTQTAQAPSDLFANYSNVQHGLGDASRHALMTTAERETYSAPNINETHELPAEASPMELPTHEMARDRSFRARRDWFAKSSTQVTVRQGELFIVTQQPDGGELFEGPDPIGTTDLRAGWWFGRRADAREEGWVPASYLQPAPEGDTQAQSSGTESSSAMSELEGSQSWPSLYSSD